MHSDFKHTVIVDWSASANAQHTGPDSIWIAAAGPGGEIASVNPPNRPAAMQWLSGYIKRHPEDPILMGFDFPLGYPQHTLAALGFADWRALWTAWAQLVLLPDGGERDRFAAAADLNARLAGRGPFWGHPSGRRYDNLASARKGHFDYPVRTYSGHTLKEWREAEAELRRRKTGPQSAWKLWGAGSVGSQALLGIAWLQRLRAWEPRVKIWPFETGMGVPKLTGPNVVVAEVWPSMLPFEHEAGVCRDERQVRALARAVHADLQSGRAHRWFTELPLCVEAAIPKEEGWVLGV